MPISKYVDNSGGLNITDSPIKMEDNQATGQSYNYSYTRVGALTKVLSAGLINTTPDSQLISVGLGTYHSVDTDIRTLIRGAGTKFQTFNITTGVFTDLIDDTSAAHSDFLLSGSTQPLVFCPFATLIGGTQLHMAGAGLTLPDLYNGDKITQNGVNVPKGSIGLTVNTHNGGSWFAVGAYYYGVQFRKRSTQATSNVSLDQTATVVNSDDTITISLSGINNIDTTLYDQIYIFRSAVSGSINFTTGSLIAQIPSTQTSYVDTGSSIADAQNIARPGNIILDQSVLPAGTYNSVSAFKLRLVVAKGSTIYFSDLNKPESWPLTNVITVPSGGDITALGTIGVPSEYTTGADQYLCIWKERELWVVTGEDYTNWSLLFVDKTGCASQSLVVSFNGFVTWITYNGIFIWTGQSRPIRVSKLIQALFETDGDLDKDFLTQGVGRHYEKENLVVWRLSHRTKGKNKLSIKLDTRLTAMVIAQATFQLPEIPAIFTFDYDNNSYYGLESFITNNDEILIAGDDQGNMYQVYGSASNTVAFDYETKPLDMGCPEVLKNFKRVLVLVEKLTPNDLDLFFWADYRNRNEYASKESVSLAPQKGTQPALWDIALWDQAEWDDYTPDINWIEYNLHSQENNSQGNSLKLRFEQLEASAPVRIHGFAIEWEPANNLPVPTQQV